MDMLSSSPHDGTEGDRENGELQDDAFQPTITAFRAIFLGFFRHGKSPHNQQKSAHFRPRALTIGHTPDPDAWSLENLEPIFQRFLDLPDGVKPRVTVLYWIIMAFAKTSGDDFEQLRRVYAQLEDRFGDIWGGRLGRLKAKIYEDDRVDSNPKSKNDK